MVCYVVLHYKNIGETKKCIDSILHIASKDSEVVVVDNGSNDGSGDELLALYNDIPRVSVLLLTENLGFSGGNNYGYDYVRRNYSPEFVIITNNDVVFYQEDFEKRISHTFMETGFAVLGPDVYVPRNQDHQNPMFQTPIGIQGLERELEEYRFYYNNPLKFRRRLWLHAKKNMLCSRFKSVNYLYNKLRGKDILDYKKKYENVGLQGSCLIFSKKFVESEEKAFDPEPFLYEEEVFLYYRCLWKNYKMVYDPGIAIRHEEAASFSYASKNNTMKKLLFMLEHHVKAREELLFFLQSNRDKL